MFLTLLTDRPAASWKRLLLYFALFTGALALRADLTPEAYAALQSNAPEMVTIEITAVTKTPQANGLQVDAQATVVNAVRSATNLKAGDAIALSYVQVPQPAGVIEPGLVPVVIKDVMYIAYLQGGPPPSAYGPAALGQSFVAQKDWPTPANPQPKGWADVGLKDVTLSQNGTQYFAAYEKPEAPWRLLTAGTPPALLNFFQSSADTPNVKVLVYRAGTMTAQNSTATLTIERAVIITNPGNQAVGDALWAVWPSAGSPPLPQPLWTWTQDKLTVINPFEKTIQEISLAPKADKK